MQPQLILIDPSIQGLGGHYLEYAQAVLSEALKQGFGVAMAVHRDWRGSAPWPTAAVFEQSFHQARTLPAWYRIPNLRRASPVNRAGPSGDLAGGQPRTGTAPGRALLAIARAWNRRCAASAFARDLKLALTALRLPGDTVVFIPTASNVELAGLAQVIEGLTQREHLRWKVLIRHAPEEDTVWWARRLKSLAGTRVGFLTDTEDLTELLQNQNVAAKTAPIPHTDVPMARPRPNGGPLRIVSLGDARKEKGFHHFPALVQRLRDLVETGAVEFVLQSNQPLPDPDIEDSLRTLRGWAPAVRLAGGPLEQHQYHRLLSEADIIPLPYDAEIYRYRSSGVMVEALVAGVPVVVPAGTWMARQVAATGGGRIFQTIGEFPECVRQMIAGYSADARMAREAAARWRNRHNAASLLAVLVDQSEPL